MAVYDQIMESASRRKKDNLNGQLNLFDMANENDSNNETESLPEVEEFDLPVKLSMEKRSIRTIYKRTSTIGIPGVS